MSEYWNTKQNLLDLTELIRGDVDPLGRAAIVGLDLHPEKLPILNWEGADMGQLGQNKRGLMCHGVLTWL